MSSLFEELCALEDGQGVNRKFILDVLEEMGKSLESASRDICFLIKIFRDVIRVSVEADVKGGDIFKEMCNSVRLCLERIPLEDSWDNVVPSVCEVITDLIDVLDASKKKFCHDYLLQCTYSSFMGIVLDISRPRKVEFIGIALKALNEILAGTSQNIRKRVSQDEICEIPQLFDFLRQCGDYDVQVSAAEVIFRILPKDDFKTDLLKSWLRPYHEEILNSFLKIKRTSFDVDVRFFLNKINTFFSAELSVYSVPCIKVEISNQELFKPKDENYDQFWVDFNEGSKSIFINCVRNIENTSGLWDAITIKANKAASVFVEEVDSYNRIVIVLKQPAQHLFDSSSATMFQGKEVKIHFHVKYTLNKILQNIFGELFNGKDNRGYITSSQSFDRYDRRIEKKKDVTSQLEVAKKEFIDKNQKNSELDYDKENKPSLNSSNINFLSDSSIFSDFKNPADLGEMGDVSSKIKNNKRKERPTETVSDKNDKKEERSTKTVSDKTDKTAKIENKKGKPENKRPNKETKKKKYEARGDSTVKGPSSKRVKNENKNNINSKRKLFDEAHNFMAPLLDSREGRPIKEKREDEIKVKNKKKSSRHTRLMESTPISIDNSMSRNGFDMDLSPIASPEKSDLKKKLRQRKKVSYAESSETEITDSLSSSKKICNPTKATKIESKNHNSDVYEIRDNDEDNLPNRLSNSIFFTTYGTRKKTDKYMSSTKITKDYNNNDKSSVDVESEILRDVDLVKNNEAQALKLSKSNLNVAEPKAIVKLSRVSDNCTNDQLPEFEPVSEDIDKNRDSGLGSSKSSGKNNSKYSQCEIMTSSVNLHKLMEEILKNNEKIDSLNSNYKNVIGMIQELHDLKSNIDNKFFSIFSKIKNM